MSAFPSPEKSNMTGPFPRKGCEAVDACVVSRLAGARLVVPVVENNAEGFGIDWNQFTKAPASNAAAIQLAVANPIVTWIDEVSANGEASAVAYGTLAGAPLAFARDGRSTI
ncbi:MAG: hypothetical protein AB7J13_02915 [Pyrinomonadaceae bacterium]